MDCGPAALKCLLDGFGIHASYGRLREACQTDVDGTSIDTLEDLANDVGLIAEQILLPVDQVTSSARDLLPAIVVVRRPGGLLHFVVAWRRHGPVVQVMDPATGRRWPAAAAFADEIHSHTMPVPAEAWRRWTASDLFHQGLRARARACGIRQSSIESSISTALKDEGWRPMAAFDATLRMIETLGRSRAFGRGDAERTLTALWRRTCDAADPTSIVPVEYWSVTAGESVDEAQYVRVRGAVMVRIRGLREKPDAGEARPLPRDVAAALAERPIEPARYLFTLLRADGVLAPAVLVLTLLFATLGVIVEALLFRSVIDVGTHLSLTGQRLAAMAAIAALAGLLLAVEFPIVRAALGFGRRLEVRLRIAFMDAIPRLADRYFRSRPSSDMAERGHSIHQVRELPNMGVQLVRAIFELLLTTVGIVLLYPEGRTIAIAAAAAALSVPVLAQPSLRERDLRQRTHTGALARFYLDAFLGLVAVRAHGAERALAREQEGLLVEWAGAARAVLRGVVTANAVQLAAGMGLAAALLFARLRTADEGAGALLLAYWALNIPVLGQQVAQIAWQYPTQRNLVLRLIEPLGALGLEQDTRTRADRVDDEGLVDRAARVELRNVSVHAGGHRILENATLTIPSGAHVAIVGASGAGKSTLVGLLLGWHVAAEGSVAVDGRALEDAWLDRIRRCTSWVDPAVQLWNQSLAVNLAFGNTEGAALGMQIRDADLRRLVEQLPDGLQTPLGEGGALVSGGEGQRVRFGRGLGRATARLVILDEPFRGLERDTRAALLRHARDRWRDATLLCVTHDIHETKDFDRVIVVSHGRIVEDGPPHELAARTDSAYHALLEAAAAVRGRLLTAASWRQLRMVDGALATTRHAPTELSRGPDAREVGSTTSMPESA
jgi:ATP-binding cassette subfamily B protein